MRLKHPFTLKPRMLRRFGSKKIKNQNAINSALGILNRKALNTLTLRRFSVSIAEEGLTSIT